MITNNYLKWLSGTASYWWNDSALPQTIDEALTSGATGITTNPLLVKRSLYEEADFWRPYLNSAKGLKGDLKCEEIIRCITVEIANKLLPIYKATNGEQGYVCAQVNPKFPGDREIMLEMGKRLASWAPNIAVKLPATAAALDVMEELTALGITTVGTVSFTVSQAVEIARRQQMGIDRARAAGKTAGKAFSVIMIGRLDDYLRDIAHDMGASLSEKDISLAGLACMKRAYKICKEQGYESKLMPSGMRNPNQAIALSGGDMSMSLSTAIQEALLDITDYSEHIEDPVSDEFCKLLMTIPEFVRAYNPDCLKPSEYLSYGATQRTLAQFAEAWSAIEEFRI